MDYDAIKTLITALLGAGGIGGSALLFGIWDRRRAAAAEAATGNTSERKELTDSWREYITRIEVESERRLKHLNDLEHRLLICNQERDWVWAAFRKLEGFAHSLRHEAGRRIFALHMQIYGSASLPDPLPDLPSTQTLYNVQKDENK